MATLDSEAIRRLKTSPEWQALSVRLRAFVLGLAVSDALTATKLLYKSSSDRNARILSYELSANPKVRAALSVLRGIPPRDALLAELDRMLAKKSPNLARVLALWLKAHLNGWATIAPPSVITKPKAKRSRGAS